MHEDMSLSVSLLLGRTTNYMLLLAVIQLLRVSKGGGGVPQIINHIHGKERPIKSRVEWFHPLGSCYSFQLPF